MSRAVAASIASLPVLASWGRRECEGLRPPGSVQTSRGVSLRETCHWTGEPPSPRQGDQCSGCPGVTPRLTLAERAYRCDDDSCRHVADRDVDAAALLAAWGELTLGVCPFVTPAGTATRAARQPNSLECLWRVGVSRGRPGRGGAVQWSRNQPATPRRGVSTGRPGMGR